MNDHAPLPSESEFSPELDRKDCPYCGEKILTKAKKCKHCGEFLDDSLSSERQQKPEIEKTEFKGHPVMFRNNPIGFITSIVLCIAGIGIVILLIWCLKCRGTKLTITNKKTILRLGILSKHTNEVYHSDVRNVQVSADMFQRMFGVGKIGISSAGQSDFEIAVEGIPNPEEVKNLINKHRRQ